MDISLLYQQHEPELDGLADAILRGLPRDPERPCYTEGVFVQKLRFALRNERLYGRCLDIRTPADGLLVSELDIAIRRARLTKRQRTVLRSKVSGASTLAIAKELGVTRQGICGILRAAMRRIIRAWRCSPYRGLRDVYFSEVNRGRR